MRLGLFGGTFDPIHLGHLILAEQCREACALERVWFIVTATPPHKQRQRTPVADRLEMARIAVAGHPAFEVSEIEADAAAGPRYTYETLEDLSRARPDDEFFYLIGADSLADLPGWRRPERVLELATLVVVNREGDEHARARAAERGLDMARIRFVDSPTIAISSTELRARVAVGRSIRYQTPRGVEAYVREHALYRVPVLRQIAP
jgi:nicotinate-nucleotide adenylyltransferase